MAIQETRDILVVERLIRILSSDFKIDFSFSNTHALGRGSRELYVFLWRMDRIKPLSDINVDPDVLDDFSREPAWQRFVVVNTTADQSPGFDFVLVDFHAIFGQRIDLRRLEAKHLPMVINRIEESLSAQTPAFGEADILLAGDFNLSCLDDSFSALRALGMAPVNPGLGTTIKDNSYDNIWYIPGKTQEYTAEWGMVKFDESEFDGNDQRASTAVSDHRPVWAIFTAGPDDD